MTTVVISRIRVDMMMKRDFHSNNFSTEIKNRFNVVLMPDQRQNKDKPASCAAGDSDSRIEVV